MSTAQLINVIVLMKCYLIVPLKVSAQTYSSYGDYVGLQYYSINEEAKSPDSGSLSNKMVIYPAYSSITALYGFYSANTIRFMPNIPFSHQNILGDFWGETLELADSTNMQQPDQESAAAASKNSSENSEIEGSIHIPHKPKYIDEEDTDQIKSTSGTEGLLTWFEITGIVVASLYCLMLILGVAGALYIYHVRQNNPDLSQLLLF